MKITIVGNIVHNKDGSYSAPILIGEGKDKRVFMFKLESSDYSHEASEPKCFSKDTTDGLWAWRDVILTVDGSLGFSSNEVLTRIKHTVLRREHAFNRMLRDLEAFENIQIATESRRERIPESIRLFVWQRDEGKCTRCGSQDKLEYDHIIPISKGGSNTERNIQLLCERCNRSKGITI